MNAHALESLSPCLRRPRGTPEAMRIHSLLNHRDPFCPSKMKRLTEDKLFVFSQALVQTLSYLRQA